MAKGKKSKASFLGRKQTVSSVYSYALFAVVFAAIGVLISWVAFAAPPNRGSTAYITASPNPTPAGSVFKFEGCGYLPTAPITIQVTGPNNYDESAAVVMWGNGCMNSTSWSLNQPGTYTASVYQKTSAHKSAKVALVAQTTIAVQ